jgi:hypothetical protein
VTNSTDFNMAMQDKNIGHGDLGKSGFSEQTHTNIPESHHHQKHIMAVDLESTHEKPTISEDGHHDQQSSEPEQRAIEQETKNNVVDWDGPDDPQDPRNWSTWKRMTQVVFATTFLLTA